MNNIANKTTFWSFLCQTNIVIPKLQRDYAQGRKGKESLREDFLSSIKDALCGEDDKSMKLDFVYGSSDEYSNFTPLDGQQRLTTLWLLHWYIAYKSGKLVEKSVQDKLIKFTYETRSSSTQFCKELVRLGSTIVIADGETIADAIIRQSWMYSAWRQDPTVQSMLRMLSGEQNNKIDGIEELFINCSIEEYQHYWLRLLEPANNCPIVFYQLDIENLGQTDDLYVKMNGRGKPLSDFENFKADLINYFEENGWTAFLDPETGYPVLMDTNWIDYFWDYKRIEIAVDDLFFGFINRFFLVRLMQNDKKRELENNKEDLPLRILYDYLYSFVGKEEERQSYNDIGFGVYKTLFEKIDDPWSLFYDLRNVLNNILLFYKQDREALETAANNPYYKGKQFKIVYVEDNPFDGFSMTQPQIVAFWAVCHYYSKLGGIFSIDSLKKWMRIIWNTSDYNDDVIRGKESVISTIQSFEGFFKDPTKPYETLLPNTLDDLLPKSHPTAFEEHIREERSKINQMQIGCYTGDIPEFHDKLWEDVIMDTERRSVFNGNIRCLILNANNQYDWSNFDTKYLNYFEYDKRGLNSWAIRNLLLLDFDLIKRYWYPKGDKRDRYWRTLFVETDKQEIIHNWLLAEPKENTKLHDLVETSSYERKMIIGTTLLEEAKHSDGVYLAKSRVGKMVLIHHQASWPYVLFDEERDKMINEYCNRRIISVDENIRLKCGVFNSKDIWFKYNGSSFVWMANGHIKMKPDDELFIEASKCANTGIEFVKALEKLLMLGIYRQKNFAEWREQTSEQYSKFRPNKKHEANKWYITDVTINDIDEKQVTVYIGADYTEVASAIFYCGIFYDDNSSNEMQRLKESIVDKLGLDLDDSNEITQQIFKSFYSDHIDDYNVIYKFFCSIVDNIKSLCERPFS